MKKDIESDVSVTVIVLVYNTPDLLLQCLRGFCEAGRAMGWQIIVVDNGSDPEISRAIDGKFSGIEVIRSERNLGFAAGNNIGLRKARGEFVILMNSDIVAQAGTLRALVEALQKDPQVGAMSPGLLTADGKPQAFAFGAEATPGYIIRRGMRAALGRGPLHDWATQEPLDVDWASAACLCVRRKMIEEIGDLDERFPLYFEDADWGLRMRAAGWRVVYNPLLRVVHLGGASWPQGPANRKTIYYRSLLLFCEKHYGRGWKLLLRTLLVLYRMLARAKSLILEIFRTTENSAVESPRRPLPTALTHGASFMELHEAPVPEFSVIMPIWNRANLAPRAIESVLRQSFGSYELIIVDDGSEDGLEKAVAPYLSGSIIYHRRPARGGVSAARNTGLSLAKGRYIAYLDSDNVWDPRFLEFMWDALNRGPVPRHVAYCMYRLYKNDRRNGECYLHSIRGEEFDFGTLLRRNYIDANTLVYSRQAGEETGAWDECLSRMDDWDYATRLTSRYRPVFVRVPLVDYYFGLATNTLTLTKKGRENRKIVLRKNSTCRHSITLYHDTIPYRFDHVAEKKYRNYIEMKKRPADTSSFFANGYPYMLQVEPTNRCNLACPFCPRGRRELGREGRDMRFEEFKPLVDELADYLLLLAIYGWGEPLLNPDFPKMVQYAEERGIGTMMSTNGHLLNNEALMADVLKAGLDTMIVAVDSLSQETYEQFRKNGDVGKVIEGIRKTVALKRRLGAKTRVNLRMVVTRYNEHEVPSIRKMARSLGVDIFSAKTVNPNSGGPLEDDREIVPANPRYRRYKYKKGTVERIRIENYCGYVWTLSNVASDGRVVACCYDYDGQMTIGNIHKEPFREIWNGEAAREVRRRVWSDRNSIPRCRDCDVNFALSRGGWFPDHTDFAAGPIGRVRNNIRRKIVAPAAHRLLRLIR